MRIGQLTSEVGVSIANDKPTAAAPKVDVSGVTVAGTPVGITDRRHRRPRPGSGAGADHRRARAAAGRAGHLHPHDARPAEVGDRTAVVTGGALEIEVPIDVQGYPGTLAADPRPGHRRPRGRPASAAPTHRHGRRRHGGVPIDTSPLPGLGESTGFDLGSPPPSRPAPSTLRHGHRDRLRARRAPGRGLGRDRRSTACCCSAAPPCFVAGRVVVRTSLRPIRRATDLRQLWRW